MMLIEETPIPLSALPVEAFKAHLRLGSGFAEDSVQDAVLQSFLRAAISAIEARTGKSLVERNFSWTLHQWRDPMGQALPLAPVGEILELAVLNRLDEEEIIDPSLYRLEIDTQRPKLCPMGSSLPTLPTGGSARVRFSAGYGATFADMPADLGQAVMLLAAHYYEYRNDTGLGDGCMPFGVTALIERYRTVRIFGGQG